MIRVLILAAALAVSTAAVGQETDPYAAGQQALTDQTNAREWQGIEDDARVFGAAIACNVITDEVMFQRRYPGGDKHDSLARAALTKLVYNWMASGKPIDHEHGLDLIFSDLEDNERLIAKEQSRCDLFHTRPDVVKAIRDKVWLLVNY